MYQIIYQEEDKIEIGLSGTLDESEFQQVIHQLESLCAMHQKINVLFDAVELEKFPVNIMLENTDFYKEYKQHLNRVAFVSDKNLQNLMVKLFNQFSDADIKSFDLDNVEEARKWIFPTKLP